MCADERGCPYLDARDRPTAAAADCSVLHRRRV